MEYILSSKGNKERNEDSYGIKKDEDIQVFLVADGCGGHASGDVASKLVVEYIAKSFLEEKRRVTDELIGEILNDCNRFLINKQREFGSMRTTIVGVVHKESNTYAFNIGDSRLYQIRDEQVVFRTEDHAVPYVLYKAGIITDDEINTHEDRNKLLQALGMEKEIQFKSYRLNLQHNDILLLATDGFWEHMYVEDFVGCTLEGAKQWLKRAKDKIVKDNDPEQDNYTAVLIGGLDG